MGETVSASERIDYTNLSVIVGRFGGDLGDMERQFGILGIKDVRVSADPDRIERSVGKERPDLVVCTMNPGQDAAHKLLRGIRHQQVGDNPFAVLVSLSAPMNSEHSAMAIDTGIDSLLLAPFNRDTFVRRINELAFHRKKFVAAPGYIGPTRRVSTRTETGAGEEFDVPNPVHAAGTGVPRREIARQISEAAKKLETRKLTNDIAAIRRLTYEILPDYEMSNISTHFHRRVRELHNIVEMLRVRAVRLANRDMIDMCELADNVLGEIAANPIPPNLKHLKAMPKLVTGFHTALMAMPEHRLH